MTFKSYYLGFLSGVAVTLGVVGFVHGAVRLGWLVL
jgi:hypothetical protein